MRRISVNLLAWLVPHAPACRVILPAGHDVPDQALAVVKTQKLRGGLVLGPGSLGRLRCTSSSPFSPSSACPSQAGLDQRPACTHPVAVAAINDLVRATREPAFRCVLARGEPRDKPWHIEHSDYVGSETSVFVVTPSVDRQADAAYLGMMRCGASRIARQPKAQKAYAPWASASGLADMPPSNVWPTWVRSTPAGGERGGIPGLTSAYIGGQAGI